jgi:hypothetical protein
MMTRVMALTTAMLLTATAVHAQSTDAASAGPKVKVERTASGQKIFRITEGIVVEGKIQKPNAFYVLQRSSMDYDWESLKQDFLPKILQAASHSPF